MASTPKFGDLAVMAAHALPKALAKTRKLVSVVDRLEGLGTSGRRRGPMRAEGAPRQVAEARGDAERYRTRYRGQSEAQELQPTIGQGDRT